MNNGSIDREKLQLKDENNSLWEAVKFLYPYAKKAHDLEANKYPVSHFKFIGIEQELKARGDIV